MINNTESIALRLKKALSLRNMRQQDLVEKTKIPKGSISQYISGYAEPKTDRTYLMAKALNVNPVWLMGFDAPMENTVAQQFNSDVAELLVTIKNTPELIQLNKDFIRLPEAQKLSVLNLVHSLLPNELL
jgi:transcriptional regulator with XRE-family HTH domain